MKKRILSIGLILSMGVGGCMVGPDYKTPEEKMPEQWGEASGPTTKPIETTRPTTQPVNLAAWWTSFEDPQLTSLIERGIQSNLDLKQAEQRVRAARAARGIAVSGLGPNVNASGSYTWSQQSNNSNNESGGFTAFDNNGDLYRAGFDASWEIDVFGGVRRNVEAATADVQASIEDRNDVLVSLLGEIATNYIQLRGQQRELAITVDNLTSQQETLDLTRSRFRAGLTDDLDVARAEAQVSTTASQIPTLEQSIAQTIHTISILLGEQPMALKNELAEEKNIPGATAEVPLGLPSDLLRRRPDIRRSERQLAAATARIGVATSDLFPKFAINGAAGFQSETIKNLFDRDSLSSSIGPSFSWPIFSSGRIQSNIEVTKAIEQQAFLAYRQTILVAMGDVENSLIAWSKEQVRRQTLVDAVNSNRRAVDLANQLYTRGVGDFLNVLEAQRSLYATEALLVRSEAVVSSNLVALYKALGGGWDPDAGQPKETATK